jgi:hypothetical protein
MYREDAAFGTISKETDTGFCIVNGGFPIGNTRALGEKTDVIALFQYFNGGFDGFQVSCTAVDRNRTEGGEDLSENGIFEKLFFCEKVDLTVQLCADKENIVHADMVGTDQASAFLQFVFKTFYFQTEEKLIDGSEESSEKTVHFCHDEEFLS